MQSRPIAGLDPYQAVPPVPVQSITSNDEAKCGPTPAAGDSQGASSPAAFSAGGDISPPDPGPTPPTPTPTPTPPAGAPPPPPPPTPPPFPSEYDVDMFLVSGGVKVGFNYVGLPDGAPRSVSVRSDGPEAIIGVQAGG